MNEVYFAFHILLIASAILFALRLGKEALICLFCILGFTANLFVLKQANLFSLVVTCTDAYIIGCDFTLALLQRHFGRSEAEKAPRYLLFTLILFIVLSQLHLLYLPSAHDTFNSSYRAILSFAPRIALSSLLVGFIAQKLNIFLQHQIEKLFPSSPAFILLFAPILLSQLFDTAAFSFLALYGQLHSMMNIVIMSYLVKVITIILMSPFSNFSKKFHKNISL
jgi:uncharacterized integral membrane protein (TIGR00697 family)